MTRRFYPAAALAVFVLAAAVGCQGRPLSIFGYQFGTGALYDPNIKTVYVPMFNNRAFQTTPYRGMEVDITRAIVREINAKTPFRAVSDPAGADTELLGNIVSITKTIQNRNQQNLTREEEVVITVDLLWRDLRDGRNLTAPRRGNILVGGAPAPGGAPPEPVPFDPDVPLPPTVCPELSMQTVRLVSTGRVLPELGQSTTTGEQQAINVLATQIVSMMEKPWGLDRPPR